MEQTRFAGWNVLIIDDEPDNVGVLSYLLMFHNIEFRSGVNGEECLRLIREQRPTLVLLDIAMPIMSGWQAIKAIRDDESLNDLPVIALTAHAMEGDRERILAAGFDAYIPKPINVVTLIDDIDRILQERKAAPTPAAVPTATPAPEKPPMQDSVPTTDKPSAPPEAPTSDKPAAQSISIVVPTNDKSPVEAAPTTTFPLVRPSRTRQLNNRGKSLIVV
jgi:CheY-like chemotaxis protein